MRDFGGNMARKRVKLVAVLCAVALTGTMPIATTTSAQIPIVDEGFIPAGKPGIGRQGIKMMERPDYVETASVLRGQEFSGEWKSCSSLTDVNCTSAPMINFGAILQQCATASSFNCIAGFGVVAPDGSKINATFDRKFPDEAANKYPADASAGLPEGGPGALWEVPASAGLPVSLHYVRISVVGSVVNGKAAFKGFAASLSPVSLTTMRCDQQNQRQYVGNNECTNMDVRQNSDPGAYSGFIEGSGWSEGLDCEMSGNADYEAETAECALRKPALLETKYFIDVRLSQSPQGWLHGRLANADVTITSLPEKSGAVAISISGKPVRVPVIFTDVPFVELPANLQEKYAATGAWPGPNNYASNWGMQDINPNDPNGRNRLSDPAPYGQRGIEELQAWMDFLKDTSTADRVTWSLRSLRDAEREQASSCITDTSRVTGLVLTNATQYFAGAPVYNQVTKSLDYKVAAPHLMSNNEVFKGSYELIIRSDVAQCIYGFSAGALEGSVSIVESESGQAAGAVTSVSESDGWLRLTATGYTHSAPTIRVVLKEKSSASMRAKKSLSSKQIVKAAGLKTKKSSRVTLSVSRKSSKVCRVQSGALRGLKKGSCRVTVTVKTGKKSVKRTILVAVR